MKTDRRTVTRAAVWGLPAVMVASAAPAFAAASGTDGGGCQPVAICKLPGEGQHTKDYAIDPRCADGVTVVGVRVRDDKRGVWIVAERDADGAWVARGFNDSRRNRLVEVTTSTGATVHSVAFPPC